MEDDDEFGDLYTDVLRQFQPPEPPNDPSPKPLIDLNLHTHDDDNDEFLFPAPNPNPNPIPKFNPTLSHRAETLVLNSTSSIPEPVLPQSSDLNRDSKPEVVRDDGLAEASASGVLESGGDGKPHEEVLNPGGRSGFELVLSERGGKDDSLVEKNEDLIDEEENFDKFDIEEAEEPVIPGVSDHGGGGNDWDSDSDDDLKIVLNESNHGDVLMDGLGGRGDEDDEDDDDDDDPLVIVAGSEPGIVPMEDREWGEDAGRVADGERKELGEATKVNGGAVVAPKIGFNGSFTYQPYHSQFKYVRPGTAPIPGPVPVGIAGVPGQVRPPVNIGPVGGFGRGDWRPTGIRNTFPMQKNIQPGFGMNVWGNNTAGRGFGSGLDFTLPSHKTIFEVDVDSFEEKPWRLPGLDMSDFFNFGLNEGSWKDYCKQLEQLRLETTMQSKIRVYESGRTEQVYDPDLPPELAAAAGIRDISSENANTAKLDGGQIDIAKGSQDVRPPLPIGRAIQVETSSVERLPSTDTRPLRIRDSDVIIEIVLEGSTNDASLPGNNVTEKLENEPLSENFRGGQESNGDIVEQQSGGTKKEMVGRRVPFINSIHDEIIEEESLLPHRPNSREHSSSYPGRDVCTLQEERKTKVGACDRSPIMTRSGSTVDKGVTDNLKEDSVESIGGKRSDQFSSPATVGSTEEPDFEHRDGLHGSSVMSDGKTFTDTHASEKPLPSVKKQNLSSQVEQSSDQAIADEGGIRAARSRENSKARSDSSRDYHRLRDSIDEEVVQHGRSTRMGNLKRPRGEDEPSVRRKSRDERHEVEKHRMVGKGWEDSHSRRDWDPHLARQSHMKTEGIDKRKEREISEGVWLQRDDDPHGRRARAEDTRNKVREREKMDKDEHLQSRKQLDNGNSRGYHDKDVASRPRERDDSLKSQYESRNDHYTKRRKEEDYLRRGGEKEEILHNHRDNPSRRKRERDDALDSRKRDDQVRIREDTYNSARHKEDDWIHRERDQMHRIKQSHEESLLKREREERREGVRRSGRAAEEKIWVPVPHARVKDEYKGTSDTDYQFKDTNRHNEQLTRRVEDGSLSQHRGREDFHSTRGSQHSKDERRSRQEREGTRRDLLVGGSDNNRVHEKKRKDNSRRSKDSEGGDGNSVGPSSRTQEDQSGHMNERAILNGTTEQGKHIENASSDEELRDSRRGRSKLERWTSHKGRDFTINSKSSSSTMKVKEIDKYENGASKLPEESSKTVENIDDQHPLGDQKGDQNDVRSVNGRHSETAEKLKQRSERFKLPMPNDKEAPMIKNMENEPLLPSAQSGAHEDPEIKPERPPRKRRWISN